MVGFVAHGEIAGMPGFFVHRPFGPRLAPFQPDRAILVWKADTRTGIAAAWARPASFAYLTTWATTRPCS
jgi:hypothetical protein